MLGIVSLFCQCRLPVSVGVWDWIPPPPPSFHLLPCFIPIPWPLPLDDIGIALLDNTRSHTQDIFKQISGEDNKASSLVGVGFCAAVSASMCKGLS